MIAPGALVESWELSVLVLALALEIVAAAWRREAKMNHDFSDRQSIDIDDLLRLDEPVVLFERTTKDADGTVGYLYTVGGWLDGEPIGTPDHAAKCWRGALVGGDCIVVVAESQGAADEMAAEGLEFTIAKHREHLIAEAAARSLNQGIQVVVAGRKSQH